MSPKVPFLDLAAQQAEIAQEVLPVWREQLTSASFIGGPEVDAFEHEYAEYVGVGHVVGVSNGTDALELAYRAVGIGSGEQIIVDALGACGVVVGANFRFGFKAAGDVALLRAPVNSYEF